MTGTSVTDLRPLATHPLEIICISPSYIREGMDILRAMKTLRNIGTDKAMYKVESFWRVYDRGDFKNQGDRK